MSYPVAFEVDYVERRSRLTAFFRLILAIPLAIWLTIYGIVAYVAIIIAWFAIVVTARFPPACTTSWRGSRGCSRARTRTWDCDHRQASPRPVRRDGAGELLHRAVGRVPVPAHRDLPSVPGRQHALGWRRRRWRPSGAVAAGGEAYRTRARNRISPAKNAFLGVRAGRVVVGVGALAVDQQEVRRPESPTAPRAAWRRRARRRHRAAHRTRRSRAFSAGDGRASRSTRARAGPGSGCRWRPRPSRSSTASGSTTRRRRRRSTPRPESIVANRVIGVSAPAPSQPWSGPAGEMPRPRWAWAARRLAGEVPDVQRVAELRRGS